MQAIPRTAAILQLVSFLFHTAIPSAKEQYELQARTAEGVKTLAG
ncbi:hypothetical protein C8E01_110106 [Pontibacter virosus]|uniref:Uncharacterized protein n=1 Tax=Pontibacter virosus TaxID=1765052 RepID=A0A2U1ATW6_9BACT|nr:hypothetical protein [Pontibacter sp. HSC-36F09]PVY39717.1 hypothetical protein C8E01_110106 [Pontibacter virosus]